MRWYLAVIGAVLLAHLAVLIWLDAYLPWPALSSKVLQPMLLSYVVVPASSLEAGRPLTALPSENPAMPVAVSRRRSYVHPAAARPGHAAALELAPGFVPESKPPAVNAATSPSGTGEGAAVSNSPQSGGSDRGNPLNLTLPLPFKPSHRIAHQARQQLDLDGSPVTGMAEGTVTPTEQRRNDGSTETRVTTPLGSYCVHTPAMPSFMSDLPMYRTALPSTCP
jgi:hypothetical protein